MSFRGNCRKHIKDLGAQIIGLLKCLSLVLTLFTYICDGFIQAVLSFQFLHSLTDWPLSELSVSSDDGTYGRLASMFETETHPRPFTY